MKLPIPPLRTILTTMFAACAISTSATAEICKGVEVLTYPAQPSPPSIAGKLIEYTYELDVGSHAKDIGIFGVEMTLKNIVTWRVYNRVNNQWQYDASLSGSTTQCLTETRYVRGRCECFAQVDSYSSTHCTSRAWSETNGAQDEGIWQFVSAGSKKLYTGPTTNSIPGGSQIVGSTVWSHGQQVYEPNCSNPPSVAVGQGFYRYISLAYTSSPPAITFSAPSVVKVSVLPSYSAIPSIINTGFDSNNNFTLTVASQGTGNFTVFQSSNLTNWTSIGTGNTAGTTAIFTVPNSSSSTIRFYRVKQGANCAPETVGFNRISKSASGALHLVPIQFASFTGDWIGDVFGGAPPSSTVYTLQTTGTWSSTATRGNFGWSGGSSQVIPGKAYFLGTPTAATITVHGRLIESYSLPANSYGSVASPPVGTASFTYFGFPGEDFDQTLLWNLSTQGYVDYSYVTPTWTPTTPTASPNQGFVLYSFEPTRTWVPFPAPTCP